MDEGGVDGGVCRRTGERLNVHPEIVGVEVIGSEELGSAPAGEGFEHVHVFDTLVVAGVTMAAVTPELVGVVHDGILILVAGLRARVAFGVDIGKRRGKQFAHCLWGNTFTGDHDQTACLSFGFELNQPVDIWVINIDIFFEQKITHSLFPFDRRMDLADTDPREPVLRR